MRTRQVPAARTKGGVTEMVTTAEASQTNDCARTVVGPQKLLA